MIFFVVGGASESNPKIRAIAGNWSLLAHRVEIELALKG